MGQHITLEPVHADFGVRVLGVDLSEPLGDETLADIDAAFQAHSVLVFPGQHLSPESQVAFSAHFGPLEKAITCLSKEGVGQHIAHLSNVAADGSLIPPTERQQLNNAANHLWHTDSTYKPQTALASMLHALEVPPEGGETEYASTRVGFRALSPALQQQVRGLWAVHDFRRSRNLVAPGLIPESVRAALPPVSRPMVRVNVANGEESLYIASHATVIEGWSESDSRELLDRLLQHCTTADRVYTHRWQPGDMVMWDNRCTLHRGRPWQATTHRRVMNRTTVIDVGYDSEPGIRAA
jgi:alpha-ketoglutarate-dependent 2,4-dichlorophenoxyacetate dioxygenase